MLPAKNFNRFDSHNAFHKCSSKDPKKLAVEIQNALKVLEKVNSSTDSGGDSTNDSSQTRSVHIEENVLGKRIKSNTSKTGKRKHSFSSASIVKKCATGDDMQESCDKCLVSSKCM